MTRFPIDIEDSKQSEKLVSKEWPTIKIPEYFLYSIYVIAFPFISIMELNSNLTKNEPIGFSLLFLILSLIFSLLLIYAIFNLNTLERIKGLSRGQNSTFINNIVELNNWNVHSTSQQMTVINFTKESGKSYAGKQMTILYDGNDILVNCISFGAFSTPSPFHLFANRKKVNKLKTEFKSGIKNVFI